MKRLLALGVVLASLSATAALRDETPSRAIPPAPAASEQKPVSPPAEAVSRGRLLYQNHCTRCHASVLHVRENRRVTSMTVLEWWVRRWSGEEKLGWDEEEIVEVTDHLNRTYYKFPLSRDKK